jgi:LacI family transcriptional regulator
MPGIEDIARELNVSASLVSKVLNGRMGTTRVSKQTLLAIRSRADDLGYHRNASAAALAMGKQNAIGVFIHRLGVAGSGIIESLVEAIANEASAHDQRLNLQFFQHTDEFFAKRSFLQPSMMDGMIIGGMIHKDLQETVAEVQKSGVSVVTLYDEPLADTITNVTCDQKAVTLKSTAHLIENGCRRLVHIGSDTPRRDGFLEAHAKAGLAHSPERMFVVESYEYHEGVTVAEQLLARKIPFDGVIAQSDQIAVGVLNTLIRRGIKVPEQVKVVGVDNSPFCPFAIVPLSSVYQEETTRGQVAVRMLLDLIAHKQVESVVVEPTLVVRESSQGRCGESVK